MLTTIRQALHLMGRESSRRWLLVLFLALGTSLLEIVAAAMVYVLLALVTNPSGTVDIPLIGDVRRLAGGAGERTLLLSLIGIMIGFFLIRAMVSTVADYVMHRVVHNAAARLSVRLVDGYLSLPYAFHLQRNSSGLIRNGHQAAMEVVNSVFNPLIRVTADVILTLGILVLLLVVSPTGTALALVVVGGATMALLLIIQPRLKRFGATAHAMNKETLESLQQSFEGVRDIKILGRERFFTEAYGRNRRRLARMMYLQGTIYQLPRLTIETSLLGFILVFFGYTIARQSDPASALSVLGLFAYAGLRLQPSLQKIVSGLNSLKFAAAPTADLYKDLKVIEQEAEKRPAPKPFPFEGDLCLDEVSFRYEGTDWNALSDVSLCITQGQQIGICGPTGGGKSTLVDVITGLLTPTAGRVIVGGRDVATNPEGWQRNIGMVPQTVFMIDDTLRRNIALGIADDEIDENALHEAVELAQLNDFVGSLPSGLDTVVGERGVRVSGGERQRVAIARALYHRPQVLVFDEGTSALDNMTERDLMLSLKELRGAHTILLVAHRLSTVRDSDRVLFVEDGHIAGSGTFDSLKSDNDAFRKMAAMT